MPKSCCNRPASASCSRGGTAPRRTGGASAVVAPDAARDDRSDVATCPAITRRPNFLSTAKSFCNDTNLADKSSAKLWRTGRDLLAAHPCILSPGQAEARRLSVHGSLGEAGVTPPGLSLPARLDEPRFTDLVRRFLVCVGLVEQALLNTHALIVLGLVTASACSNS
eukprot:scaffold61212_cov66-Phaeocystis_antarctica.AAC.2